MNYLRYLRGFLFTVHVILLFSVSGACAAGIRDSLPAASLEPFGRYLRTPAGELELIGSAVHFGFEFSGKSCLIYTRITGASGHNYLQYELDGRYIGRVRIESLQAGSFQINAHSGGQHRVWIYKATEAQTGPLFIVGIAGRKLKSLAEPDRPLIEFIGNSITCGAAADPSETPCGMGSYHDQHNAYLSYGPRLARSLHCNYIMSCVSGIGIYRNWNSDGPTMPQVYGTARLQFHSKPAWNFSLYKPDIVSIALGTNDYSDGDGKKPRLPFDSAEFVNHYIGFVEFVKSKYPAARIVLLSSPMVHGTKREQFQRCLADVKSAIDLKYPSASPVGLFFFDPMQGRGCAGHPNVEQHAVMARALEPFFRKLLENR